MKKSKQSARNPTLQLSTDQVYLAKKELLTRGERRSGPRLQAFQLRLGNLQLRLELSNLVPHIGHHSLIIHASHRDWRSLTTGASRCSRRGVLILTRTSSSSNLRSLAHLRLPSSTMSKIGSLRWVRLARSLEPLVRVRMRTPLRLHPLVIVDRKSVV